MEYYNLKTLGEKNTSWSLARRQEHIGADELILLPTLHFPEEHKGVETKPS